mgnify:CR=1 FL=1
MEKRFLIRWNEQVVRELVIMANSEAEAMALWEKSNWEVTPDISEEEIIPKTVSANLIE